MSVVEKTLYTFGETEKDGSLRVYDFEGSEDHDPEEFVRTQLAFGSEEKGRREPHRLPDADFHIETGQGQLAHVIVCERAPRLRHGRRRKITVVTVGKFCKDCAEHHDEAGDRS